MMLSLTRAKITAIVASSLLLSSTVASAFDCSPLVEKPKLQAACNINNDLAWGGNYIGSCVDGGRCADSVNNKLVSANSKINAGKYANACDNLASIQSDLLTWATAAKPKIDQLGYNSLHTAIADAQGDYCEYR